MQKNTCILSDLKRAWLRRRFGGALEYLHTAGNALQHVYVFFLSPSAPLAYLSLGLCIGGMLLMSWYPCSAAASSPPVWKVCAR